MSSATTQPITWNLTDLYPSIHSLKITEDLQHAQSKAQHFETKYKPLFKDKIEHDSFPFTQLLEDYKEILTLLQRLQSFAHLSFAEKTNHPETGAFMQKIQTATTEIYTHLLFFDVEWNRLDSRAAAHWIHHPHLEKYKHFLEKMRIYALHTLNEGEEKIMALKSNTGGRAFSRLFDEVINNIPFYFEKDGQKIRKSEAEILSTLHSPHREERKLAGQSLAEGLKENTHILTYTYNMILADHRTNMKIRNYKHPMDAMNLANEIDLESVLNLVQSVKAAYPVAMRYYRLKKKLLNLDQLYDYDRYAPLGTDESKISFDQCKQMVLDGYFAFSKEAGTIVEQFFSNRWIDAEIREGKQGGAFCAQTTPDVHPYVLVNYTGSLRDVLTVAHELGHGLHQYLAGKRVGILESDAPLTLAETASVFGEMLIFEKVLEKEKDPRKRLHLLCGKIDDEIATVFRQICLTDFEMLSHDSGLAEGELASDRLSDLWIKANSELYGDSVTLTDNYRHGWKYIPHFVHSPFYCYAYSFAQIFVLTLYQKYKSNKTTFVPHYLEMLSLGGSKNPSEIAAIAGLDIRHSDFWKSGIGILENLIAEAEKLAQNY